MTRHYTPRMAVIRAAVQTAMAAAEAAMDSDNLAEADFGCRMQDAIAKLPAVPDDDEIGAEAEAHQRAAEERHKQWVRAA